MTDVVYNPMHPYHENEIQVNRFLDPMKKYSQMPTSDITEHRRKLLYNLPEGTGSFQSFFDYNNAKHLYGTDEEYATLSAVKQKAINASHEFLLEPSNKTKEDLFNASQYELRQRRGGYIAKYLKFRKSKLLKPFGYNTPPLLDKKKTNSVEFTCTIKGENNIPVPIVSKAGTDYNIFDMLHSPGVDNDNHLILKIFEVLESAQENITRHYNNLDVNREVLKLFLSKVKDDLILRESSSLQYFKHLGTNAERWDDTARKQISSAEWNNLEFLHRGNKLNISYRSAINHIVPTKVKVEHNVKTVHKFALDFTKILKPMTIDLIIKMNNIEFVWTIHEFEPLRHQIYHAGYLSTTNTFFNMPKTLEDMTQRYEAGIEPYIDPFFKKSTIEVSSFDKKNDASLLNLHTYALRVKIDELNGSYKAGQDVFDNESSYTDVGYIYKYNQYVIVASGITHKIHPFHEKQPKNINIMFYTIIHWNHLPNFNPVKTDPSVIVPTNKDMNARIDQLSTYIKNVDANYSHLLANRPALPEAAFEKLNFFIPAILFKNSSDVDPKSHQVIGVYFLEDFPRDDIEYIKHVFNKEKMRILQLELKLHIDFDAKLFPDQAMIQHLKDNGYEKDDTKRIETNIGVFGYFLKKLHDYEVDNRLIHADGTIIKTELEIWSDFWHEYFALRPQYSGMYSFEQEDSRKMKTYHTRIRDEKDKIYFHHRKEMKNQHRLDFSKVNFQKRKPYPRNNNPRPKKNDPSQFGFQSRFVTNTIPSSTRLASAVTCTEFTPQDTTLKMQAEIDALKRTLNELTLKAQLY